MFHRKQQAVDWQKPLGELPDILWDVLVIGAGPAGSAAAIYLSRAGYKLLMVDMAHYPRTKICGDCMITDVSACLERAGLQGEVEAAGTRLDGISMFSTSGVEFSIPGSFVTLPREALDTILARKAVDCGATFARGQISSLSIDGDGGVKASARKSTRPVRARFGLVATGAHIGIARRLGAVESTRPSAVAGRCYVRSKVHIDKVILSYDRSLVPGYGWIVPLGDGIYNVGCGYFLGDSRARNLPHCFESFRKGFPLAKELLADAERLSPLRAAPLRCGLRGVSPQVGHSVLIAGEAIGTTFSLTGEGIGQAMITGELAAASIEDALRTGQRRRLDQYRAAIDSQLRPRHSGFEYAQKWVSRPWLNDFMARRLRKSDYLRDACSRFVADSGDPRVVYSLSAVFKSFFK